MGARSGCRPSSGSGARSTSSSPDDRPVDAAEALAMGLANRVVPRGQARAEAEALARTIAAFPPYAVRSDRRSAYETRGLTLEAALRREHAIGRRWRASGDRLEGARRFAAGAGRHGKF